MTGVAVVGAGNWGKNLVRVFASLGDVELKYVCDRTEAVREAMIRLYPQASVTDDYQQLLDDDSVDAIVVAVDAPRHFELAAAALTIENSPLTLYAARGTSGWACLTRWMTSR